MKNIRKGLLRLVNYAKESLEKSIGEKEAIDENSGIIEENKDIKENQIQEDLELQQHSEEKNIITKEIEPEQSIENEKADKINDETSNKLNAERVAIKYMFPPLSLLQKGFALGGESAEELKETAMRLWRTLSALGVKSTIADISRGPRVTRYELYPEQGVRISKILSLTDDIKLSMAAADIRIIAPIPGKAAIGIELPNKVNMPVVLRDLFETKEFKEFPSNITFAVGKDIVGRAVVSDIAKTPNMLIAGTTGSGKSVFINTIIMSILYKAHPDDVKFIMIDTKAVNLSVYNGIPHLLIPVVTDPRKSLAALHWVQSEIEDRYRKFSDYGVKNLKEYNILNEGICRLPQIVVIIDDLYDLMASYKKELEQQIADITRLSRPAGVHIIISTQRPSSDVVTGLIKSNIPSRAAFKVFSAIDSRVILEEKGAEKLLGNGDMLFKPQDYISPVRIQAPYVSNREVSDVVEFLRNQTLRNAYTEDISEKIRNMGMFDNGLNRENSITEIDELFEKAGRFIIDKDKASIGMLQRVLKIGFNRAAKIMDQLSKYGVVGEEEGTAPRKVLMTMEQFERLVEELV